MLHPPAAPMSPLTKSTERAIRRIHIGGALFDAITALNSLAITALMIVLIVEGAKTTASSSSGGGGGGATTTRGGTEVNDDAFWLAVNRLVVTAGIIFSCVIGFHMVNADRFPNLASFLGVFLLTIILSPILAPVAFLALVTVLRKRYVLTDDVERDKRRFRTFHRVDERCFGFPRALRDACGGWHNVAAEIDAAFTSREYSHRAFLFEALLSVLFLVLELTFFLPTTATSVESVLILCSVVALGCKAFHCARSFAWKAILVKVLLITFDLYTFWYMCMTLFEINGANSSSGGSNNNERSYINRAMTINVHVQLYTVKIALNTFFLLVATLKTAYHAAQYSTEPMTVVVVKGILLLILSVVIFPCMAVAWEASKLSWLIWLHYQHEPRPIFFAHALYMFNFTTSSSINPARASLVEEENEADTNNCGVRKKRKQMENSTKTHSRMDRLLLAQQLRNESMTQAEKDMQSDLVDALKETEAREPYGAADGDIDAVTNSSFIELLAPSYSIVSFATTQGEDDDSDEPFEVSSICTTAALTEGEEQMNQSYHQPSSSVGNASITTMSSSVMTMIAGGGVGGTTSNSFGGTFHLQIDGGFGQHPEKKNSQNVSFSTLFWLWVGPLWNWHYRQCVGDNTAYWLDDAEAATIPAHYYCAFGPVASVRRQQTRSARPAPIGVRVERVITRCCILVFIFLQVYSVLFPFIDYAIRHASATAAPPTTPSPLHPFHHIFIAIAFTSLLALVPLVPFIKQYYQFCMAVGPIGSPITNPARKEVRNIVASAASFCKKNVLHHFVPHHSTVLHGVIKAAAATATDNNATQGPVQEGPVASSAPQSLLPYDVVGVVGEFLANNSASPPPPLAVSPSSATATGALGSMRPVPAPTTVPTAPTLPTTSPPVTTTSTGLPPQPSSQGLDLRHVSVQECRAFYVSALRSDQVGPPQQTQCDLQTILRH